VQVLLKKRDSAL